MKASRQICVVLLGMGFVCGVQLWFPTKAQAADAAALIEAAEMPRVAESCGADASMAWRERVVSQIPGFATGVSGGKDHNLITVTSGDSGQTGKSVNPGTVYWAVNEARKKGGGWIVFAPSLFGKTIRVDAALDIGPNTTIDGACGAITLIAKPSVNMMRIQKARNVILTGLRIRKDEYADGSAESEGFRDAISLFNEFGDVAIVHNDFTRCGDGCIDATWKSPRSDSVNVTIAYNRFTDHNKTMLIGDLTCFVEARYGGKRCAGGVYNLSPGQTPPVNVTVLGNVFLRTSQRHPRVIANALVDVAENLFVLAPVTYPNGRQSAVYGSSASAGAILFSERNIFVAGNAAMIDIMAVGPLGDVRDSKDSVEGGGKISVRDNAFVGPFREKPTQVAGATAWPNLPRRIMPAQVGLERAAQCIARSAGASFSGTPVAVCHASN